MKARVPPTAALEALDAFARTGSVWRAAEELGITRSAVSHRLAQLEACLGFEVLERAGKGATLTLRGQRYAREIRRSLALIAEAATSEDEAPLEGTLRISSTAGFASMWLCSHLSAFHERHPSLALEIASPRELGDVSNPAIDLFIAFGEGDWPSHILRHLYDVEFLPVCSPSLLNRRGGIEQPADLLRFPLLHLGHREDWGRWLTTNGVDYGASAPGIVFSDMLLVQAAAIAGQGIMMGDNVMCTGPFAAGQLVSPFSATVRAPGSYYLVIPPRRQSHPGVRAFAAWIEDLILQTRAEAYARGTQSTSMPAERSRAASGSSPSAYRRHKSTEVA